MPELEKDAVAPPAAPSRRARRNRLLWWGLILLFLVGAGYRCYHLVSGEWLYYSHDMSSHVENVKYVAEHHWLAPTTEDWNEYDQAPLYYIVASWFYVKGQTPEQSAANLAPLGFCIGMATLYVVFYSLRYISSWIHRYTLFIFIAFVPSFILGSSCVGNDGLTTLFGALSMLFVLRLNRNPGSDRNVVFSLGSFWGTVASKYNGTALLLATPWVLWRRAQLDSSWKQSAKRFVWVGLVSVVFTGAVFFRQWSYETNRFIFAHPVPGPGYRVIWEYMEIKENLFVYAVRFDLAALIAAGQTTTTENTPDMVHNSFPSWEYGNMLLGEYEVASDPVLLFCSRQVIITGTVLLFGLIIFVYTALFKTPFWPWQRLFTLDRLALLMIFTSTFLVLKLVFLNPDACAADYRYQGTTFTWMGYCIGRGLSSFPRSLIWKIFIAVLLAFFVYANLYFITYVYLRRG